MICAFCVNGLTWIIALCTLFQLTNTAGASHLKTSVKRFAAVTPVGHQLTISVYRIGSNHDRIHKIGSASLSLRNELVRFIYGESSTNGRWLAIGCIDNSERRVLLIIDSKRLQSVYELTEPHWISGQWFQWTSGNRLVFFRDINRSKIGAITSSPRYELWSISGPNWGKAPMMDSPVPVSQVHFGNEKPEALKRRINNAVRHLKAAHQSPFIRVGGGGEQVTEWASYFGTDLAISDSGENMAAIVGRGLSSALILLRQEKNWAVEELQNSADTRWLRFYDHLLVVGNGDLKRDPKATFTTRYEFQDKRIKLYNIGARKPFTSIKADGFIPFASAVGGSE